jgi:glutathione S-transferase
MKLRLSPTSPYARKVVVLARETGLIDAIELLPTDPWDPDSDLAADNPLGKVPALITEAGTFMGSQLCCEYLDHLHQGAPLFPPDGPARWQALRFQVLGDGILDAAVGRVIEELRRPKEYVYAGYVERQTEKIRRCLDLLEGEADSLAGPLTIGGIAIACALGYLDFRFSQLAWREGRPKLTAWYAAIAERPSMQASAPPG